MSRLDDELTAIPDLSQAELRELWNEMGEGEAPRMPPPLLRRLLAQRLQERRHSALPTMVVRELERVAGRDAPPEPVSRRIELSPGTRLVREWNSLTISVDVLEDGFAWNNRTWNSLSEIARHVTGAHWSGPRFFGLTGNG